MTLPVPADFQYPLHRDIRYLPNFWTDHYTRLPDIYHRFALSTDAAVTQLARLVRFSGCRVLDLGSGTGRSAFAMAELGARVLGVDPSPSMRDHAERMASPLQDVEFLDGSTSRLPRGTEPFDLVTCFYAPFAPEGRDQASPTELRDLVASLDSMLRPQGLIAVATVIPGWKHPWMAPGPVSSDGFHQQKHWSAVTVMRDAGFEFDDEIVTLDYGTLEEALETYGFIYGPAAIDWLLERNSASVPFGSRIYWRRS